MSDKDRPKADSRDVRGPSAASDDRAKVAPKDDERPPEEQKAEADLLKSSGGNPLTQEG